MACPCQFFIQKQNDFLIIGLIRLTGQHKSYLQFPFSRILRNQIKDQFVAIRDQAPCLGIDTRPQLPRLNLFSHRLRLIESHRQLPGGNHHAGTTQDIDLDRRDVTLPLFIDLDNGNDHFLQRRSPMDKTAPRSFETKAID